MYIPDIDNAYGWLEPNGRYHEVADSRHNMFFDCMEMSTREAEKSGWIHLADGDYSHWGIGLCSRLTAEQRNWLLRAGFELQEGDKE